MRDSTVLAGTTLGGTTITSNALDGTVLIGTTPAGTAPAGTTPSPRGLTYVVRCGRTRCAPLHCPARHAKPYAKSVRSRHAPYLAAALDRLSRD